MSQAEARLACANAASVTAMAIQNAAIPPRAAAGCGPRRALEAHYEFMKPCILALPSVKTVDPSAPCQIDLLKT